MFQLTDDPRNISRAQMFLGTVAVAGFLWFTIYLLDLLHLVVTAGSRLHVADQL